MKANTGRKNEAPRKQKLKTASEIIDCHIKGIINGGDYVDSSRVYHDLVDMFPEVKGNATFRVIQSINKFVDSAIDVYWHTNSIRIFFDVEKFIVQLYNKWKKKTCDRFEDIGIGSLSKNVNIVKKFEFYDTDIDTTSMLVVEKNVVLSCAVEYMSPNRGKGQQRQQFQLDPDSNKKFDAFLLSKLQKMYHYRSKAIGVTVDFASLFHQIIASKGRERSSINDCKDQLCIDLEKSLTSSFQQLIESSSWKSQQAGRLSSDELQSLADVFSSINVFDFKALLPSLSSKLSFLSFLPNGVEEDNIIKIPKEDFLASKDLLHLFQAEEFDDKRFLFSNNIDPLFDRCIIAITDYFLRTNLLSSYCDGDDLFAGVDNDDITTMLEKYFEGNILKDIPRASLKALFKTSKKIVKSKKQQCLIVEGSLFSGTDASTSLNYDVMLTGLQERAYEQMHLLSTGMLGHVCLFVCFVCFVKLIIIYLIMCFKSIQGN